MGGMFTRHPHVRLVRYDELDAANRHEVDLKMSGMVRISYETADATGYKFRSFSRLQLFDDVKIIQIPSSAWRSAIGHSTPRPYILEEHDIDGPDDLLFSITFIHNLHVALPPQPVPPSLILSRAAVAHAIAHDAVCAISHESLSTLADFRVGSCGHVFGTDATRYTRCPLCTVPVAWSSVSRSDMGLDPVGAP